MRSLWEDVRFGMRMLGRQRGLTLIGVLTLGLGIGVNTAIFSTVAGYFWSPLPYGESDRLVFLTQTNPSMGFTQANISRLDGEDWRAAKSLESLAIYRTHRVALSGSGEPQSVEAVSATPELFEVLKTGAAKGRVFNDAERGPGEHRVAVISDGLWRRQFAADERAIGAEFRIDGKNYALAGVMPPDFHFFYRKTQIFVPLDLPPDSVLHRDARGLRAIARLKPGASVEQAAQEVRGLSLNLEKEYPATNRGWIGDVRPISELILPRGARISISTMYYAVTFVLLIACVNIASLLLSRGTLRRKELAIRAALGAGRAQLTRLLLTESALLGLAGGALGILLAYLAVPGLRTIAPQDLGNVNNIAIDLRGLGYGVLISLASGLVAGLIPALAMSRGELAGALHSAGRGTTAGRHRTLTGLVVAEMVLSVVLLAASGLVVKSIVTQLTADPGFNKERLITATVALPQALYPEKRQAADFYRRALEQLRQDGRIVDAAATQTIPLGGSNSWSPVFVESARYGDARDRNLVGTMLVTTGYFETMGIPMMAGRTFTDSDNMDAPPVAIINQTMAKQYWPDDPQPLGRRLKLGSEKKERWSTVVGIARDARHRAATEPARPEVYTPHAQEPWNTMTVVARTRRNPQDAVQALRQAVWTVDRDQPLYNVESMEDMIDRLMAGPRATAQVMGFLGALALILAAVGIYGVISYMASQRMREIGVRLALGAERGSIFRMVLNSGIARAGAGLALGLAAATGVTPLLRRILSGVEPHDAATFAGAGAVLMLAATAAALAPAIRAMRVDPVRILREE